MLARRVVSSVPSLLSPCRSLLHSACRPLSSGRPPLFPPPRRATNTLLYVCLGTALSSIAFFATSTSKDTQCESDERKKGETIGGSKLKFHFHHAATVFPHPDKEYKGGEDAYFVSKNGLVLGVADGVGGWASKGVDPAIYARALMSGAELFSNDHPDIYDPVQIMQAAQHLGSSTCCIVVLNPQKQPPHLNSANLGDSGFMVIRDNTIVFRTKEQQHRFNFPFQLGNTSKDKPQHSYLHTLTVQPGDIVILGTCVVQLKGKNPQQISNAVAMLARENAARRTGPSPFSDGSTNFGRPRQGGKMDDITVVVGVVA